ncbi:MAG: T9SS type A sorting domain-containing protein [Candidatus Eisenbacteria bacterium]|nr:T9SS type A sorting domain-containing protein [Candidatus Eisenbacteria bacterium]
MDDEFEVGAWSSIDLDSSDYPHIAYYDNTNSDLRYARWDGSEWQIEVVDAAGAVGLWLSMAVDGHDRPHISYCDYDLYNLKYAYFDGSQWRIETVNQTGNMGWFGSIAVDSHDRPHISCQNTGSDDLMYAHWDGSQWQLETVHAYQNTGSWTSIAVDGRNNPHISFEFSWAGDLYYAMKESSAGVWDGGALASGFALHPAMPSPAAGGGSAIRFRLPRECAVELSLHDVLGREVGILASGVHQAGEHMATVGSLPAGVYLYKLTAGGFEDAGKLVVR